MQCRTTLVWTAVSGLCLLALAVAKPSQATVLLDHDFARSSTGTATIGIGDTIAFEAFITIAADQPVTTVALSFTGDIDAAEDEFPPCPDPHPAPCFRETAHIVSAWQDGAATGGRRAALGMEYVSGPTDATYLLAGPTLGNPGVSIGNSVYQGFYFRAAGPADGGLHRGTGVRSLMGTVTITADRTGTFRAGSLVYPGVTGVYTDLEVPGGGFEFTELETTVVGGAFTVHAPEPGTALLLSGGLVAFAFSRRRRT